MILAMADHARICQVCWCQSALAARYVTAARMTQLVGRKRFWATRNCRHVLRMADVPIMAAMAMVITCKAGEGSFKPNRIRSSKRGNSMHPMMAIAAQIVVYTSDCLKIWNCSGVMRPDVVTFGNIAITMVLDRNTVKRPSVAAYANESSCGMKCLTKMTSAVMRVA